MRKRYYDLLKKPDAYITLNNLQDGAHIRGFEKMFDIDGLSGAVIYAELKKRTVRRWHKLGLIHPFKIDKYCTYFKLSELT